MIETYFLCDDRNVVSMGNILESFVLSHLLSDALHIRTVLHGILFGCEAWSLSLKEKHNWRCLVAKRSGKWFLKKGMRTTYIVQRGTS
jgi:hypothetical protein